MGKNNSEISSGLTGEIIRVIKKESKFGQSYYDIMFKMTETGSCFRSCIYPNCRNYSSWRDLLTIGNVISNLKLFETKNRKLMIDADSFPLLIRNGNPKSVSIQELKDKFLSYGSSVRKVRKQLQESLF